MATTQSKVEIWMDAEQQKVAEEKMFQQLGISPSDVNQQQLVRGIRRAIGLLAAANMEIVKALKEPGSGDLLQAEAWLNDVAGDEPPGCQLPLRR